MEENDSFALLKLLAPFLAGTVMLTLLFVVLLFRFTHIGAPAGGNVNAVTFDVVKFANAQRAVASAFLKNGSASGEANDILLNLSARTRKTIEEIAGPNTVVLVKESVVQGVSRDITDDVLKKLGMPLNVPTSDAAAYTLDVAPTMLAHPLMVDKPRSFTSTDAQLP